MVPGNLLEDELMAPGCINGVYIDSVAVAERGTWPVGLLDEYPLDAAHFREYATLARTDAGFATYLERFVHIDARVAA